MKDRVRDYAIGGIFLGCMIIAYFVLDSLFLALLLAALVGGAVAGAYFLVMSALQDFKKTENKEKGIVKIVAGLFAVLVAVVIFILSVSSPRENGSPRCINCGKNGMWTETGYCYDCYNEVKSYYEEE